MKTRLVILSVVLLGMLGCTKENPLNENLVDGLPAASSDGRGLASSDGRGLKPLVPFKGTFETVSIPLDTPPSNPPQQRLKITGTGQASHLGKASFVSFATIVFAGPPPFRATGTSTMTAANGDQLLSDFTVVITPQLDGTSLAIISHIITGGTGRFAGARGHYGGTTRDNPTNPVGFLPLAGEISY